MPHEWVDPFLKALAVSPNVTAACRAADVSRVVAYAHRKADPEFAAAWDDALDQSTDNLVGECYRRAFEGVEKPVFYKDAECGRVREYSDTLAIFLLKAHRRATYGEKSQVDVTSNGKEMRGPITIVEVRQPTPRAPEPEPGDEDPAPAETVETGAPAVRVVEVVIPRPATEQG